MASRNQFYQFCSRHQSLVRLNLNYHNSYYDSKCV